VTIAASATELRAALKEQREATGKPPTKQVFADFHIHTRFSRDSILPEERFIRIAVERGLTHVAVTNHNNVEGAIAVRDKVAELGLTDKLTVILGEEVSTADGEVVGIFLTKTIPRGLSAKETADEIHRQGGLVSIPHPFDPLRGSHIKEGPLRNLAEVGKIDMVEVFNCRVTLQRHNVEAAEFAHRYGIPGIAASDSHSSFEVAMAFNALPAFDTADELKAVLPQNDWHASRSSVFIHATTRWAVWKNLFDAWRGKRTATGPILGPQAPEEVRREPVQRPTRSELPSKEPETDDDREGERPMTGPLTGPTDDEREEVILDDQVSLRDRVLNVRTIGSLLFGVLLLVLLFNVVFGGDFDWGTVVRLVGQADLGLLALAFLAYYVTFPLRGFRWRYVLRRSGVSIPFRDATEILFLSWFVNCLVPAKLGDLYRAYLLRGNFAASISRTVGTVFIERIADIIIIATLALSAGYWSFRGRSRPDIDALFIVGSVVAIGLIVLVLGLRLFGARIGRWLPARIGELWDRFHEGSTGVLTTRSAPIVLGLTVAIWMLEGARLYFVIRALDLPEVGLGISASVFVALAAALLTAIPLTPAGFGFVEAGIIGVLSIYGVVREPAAAVALVDRGLTIGTVIILGGILYAVSTRVRRAHGGRPAHSTG